MTDDEVVLSAQQRALVDAVIVRHCEVRKWLLHARNVRTNHVHIVVTAPVDGEIVREQFKTWASRGLSDQAGLSGSGKNGRRRWWTEKGDIELIFDEAELHRVIRYVLEGQ